MGGKVSGCEGGGVRERERVMRSEGASKILKGEEREIPSEGFNEVFRQVARACEFLHGRADLRNNRTTTVCVEHAVGWDFRSVVLSVARSCFSSLGRADRPKEYTKPTVSRARSSRKSIYP